MLIGNLEKIAEHGRRADGIVTSMLAHSRSGSGERQTVDINSLVDESLNLAYHGACAQDQNFNIAMERDLGRNMAPIELVPQDVTLPVHSFHTLLGDLATLTRNVVRLGRDHLTAILATPTRTQRRALDLLGVMLAA